MGSKKVPCSGPNCKKMVPGRIDVRDPRPTFCGRVCASEYRASNRDKGTGSRRRSASLDLK